MPNGAKGGFFGGLLEGVGTALLDAKQQKLKQEHENNATLASVLLKALDADPTRETATAVLPKVAELFHEPVTTLFGLKLGKGAKGGGADPISQMLGGIAQSYPTRQELTDRSIKQKETEAGAAEKGRLDARAADEGHQLDRLRKEWQDPEIQQAFGGAEHFRDFLTDRGFFKNVQPKPPTPAKDIAPDPSSPTGWSRKYFAPSGEILRTEPAPAPANERVKAGTPEAFVKQREAELGHKLTAKEQIQAHRDWVDAGDTPAEKLERAKALATYRSALNQPTGSDYAADVKTTTTGSKYLDLSTYDVKTRQKAREWANTQGVMPVSKEQGNALVAVDTARMNMVGMKDTILGKLPKDPSGRVTSGLANKLNQYFQTDADLAAWGAWRESAVQQVRAMQGVGSGQYRLTQQMVNLIISNDIPTLTDTVDTANRKFDVVSKQLNDVESSIVVRDRTTLVPQPPAKDPPKAPPADIQNRLKAAPPARYRDTKTGTYWLKNADGSIVTISKEEYEK